MAKILAEKLHVFISCTVNTVQAKQCAAAGSGCLELWKQSEKKSGSQVKDIAILHKKGPENKLAQYAVKILSRKLNVVDEILKTYFPWFCATL